MSTFFLQAFLPFLDGCLNCRGASIAEAIIPRLVFSVLIQRQYQSGSCEFCSELCMFVMTKRKRKAANVIAHRVGDPL